MNKRLRKTILQVRGFIKQSDFLFSLRRRFVDKDLQREKKLMKDNTVKTAEEVKAEKAEYARYWKCRPDDYIRYGLFRMKLPMENILDYVPMHYYYCDFPNTIDGKEVNESEGEDKLAQYRNMQRLGIKVPEIVALFREGRTLSVIDEKPIAFETIKEKLGEGQKYFVKPVDGRCGVGIFVMTKRDGELYVGDRRINSLSDMNLDPAYDFIVQKQLIQRKDLSAINESTLNTLRTIVTYRDGKPRLLGIILRIGRAGSIVDNSGQGGISVAVDLETGRFSELAGREHGGGKFAKHPDTGYVFSEGGIENWPEVYAQINEIIGKIARFGRLGWDLAIGEDGVYAIEYNLGFGIEHAQTILGGFRRKLEIEP